MDTPLLKCPFNPLHRVKWSRIQAHIVKCEKNYPGYLTCPYNATHRFKPLDLRQHVMNCPSQMLVNPARIPPVIMANKQKPKPQQTPRPEDDSDYECWD